MVRYEWLAIPPATDPPVHAAAQALHSMGYTPSSSASPPRPEDPPSQPDGPPPLALPPHPGLRYASPFPTYKPPSPRHEQRPDVFLDTRSGPFDHFRRMHDYPTMHPTSHPLAQSHLQSHLHPQPPSTPQTVTQLAQQPIPHSIPHAPDQSTIPTFTHALPSPTGQADLFRGSLQDDGRGFDAGSTTPYDRSPPGKAGSTASRNVGLTRSGGVIAHAAQLVHSAVAPLPQSQNLRAVDSVPATPTTPATSATNPFPATPTSPEQQPASSSGSAVVQKEHACTFPGCTKTFDRRYNLTVHYRRHTDEMPYPCKVPGCTQKFKWRSSQSHHMKTRHQGHIASNHTAAAAAAVAAAAAGLDVGETRRRTQTIPTSAMGTQGGVSSSGMGDVNVLVGNGNGGSHDVGYMDGSNGSSNHIRGMDGDGELLEDKLDERTEYKRMFSPRKRQRVARRDASSASR